MNDEPLSTSLAGAVVPVVPELANPSSENLGHCVEVDLSILPPVHLDAQAVIVDIPILVVLNDDLKSHMTWSMNNSVLVQSNWLEMDDPNSTPSSADSEDFGTHVNDDMYSFMIRTASTEQVKLLREAVHDEFENNARPTQPINERDVFMYRPKYKWH
ncbi:hypothetical protein M5K25_025165 [Dendrobium thyrsiflorum]|uniref:Uncharacterized protein n=1 Tax=Dendrobium thyrsiflorum TaxID=117978 RepID=A0ABD0U8H3_DENTH